MGRFVLFCRLAARDVRQHLAQALLLVVAIAVASAALTMALALNGVTNNPYQRTRSATRGPDVVAYLGSAGQATSLIHAQGVTEYSGPYLVASDVIDFHGRTAGVQAEGRSQTPAAVDQPKVVTGSWVRRDGVVLERTFAEALGVEVGDRVTLDGHPYTVVGVAVTAANAPYPNLCYQNTGDSCVVRPGISSVGLAWVTESAAHSLVSSFAPPSYVLNLKLADPANAQAFVNTYSANATSSPGGFGPHPSDGPVMATWQSIATADALLVTDEQGVLTPGSILLALLAIASVAVLVGRRLSEYTRRVGLLKAVGGTPASVAATFLVENVLLAIVATLLGIVVGWLAAPLITSPGAGLLGSAGAPSLTPLAVVAVFGVALVVVLAATLVPSLRAARSSTVQALADVARPPKRRGLLVRLSSRLPVPLLFGLRLVARRPRRTILSAANIAVTVAGLVAVVAFHTSVAAKLAGDHTGGALSNPVVDRDEQMLLVITIMLVTLAALNAIFTTWATVLDAKRAAALMRALGARVRQVSRGLAVAQVLAALPGAILGVPLGIALISAASGGSSQVPSPLWLVVTVLGTLVVLAGLTSVPARIGSRQPVVEILQAEA
jgi:putative ABC transport system permease protein